MGRVMGRDDGQAQAPVWCRERHPAAWRAPCGCVAPPSDPGGRGTWRQAASGVTSLGRDYTPVDEGCIW